MASTTWSVEPRAAAKSSVKGMSKSSSCFDRRCGLDDERDDPYEMGKMEAAMTE